MHSRLLAAIALTFAFPASAHPVDYSNPYDDAPRHGLRFADLEFAMPRDPLLWSSDPGWEAHHTPARLLSDATGALSEAVPIGTNAEAAAAILRKAGAHCGPASASGFNEAGLICKFTDVEFRDGGDYTDNVTWTVSLPLQDHRVNGLTVTRDWTRR